MTNKERQKHVVKIILKEKNNINYNHTHKQTKNVMLDQRLN